MTGAAGRAAALGLGALMSLIGAYAAATLLGTIPLPSDDAEPRTRRIYVLATPIHTDLLLPIVDDVADWRPLIATDAFPGAPADRDLLAEIGTHVGFGWGAEAFFLNVHTLNDIRARFLLDAVWDDPVVHVTVFRDPAASPAFLAIDLDDAGYRQLVSDVTAAFGDAPVPLPGESYFDADGFFRGTGTYSPLVTCNVWAGALLRRAGVPLGLWTPFAGSLTASLRLGGAITEER